MWRYFTKNLQQIAGLNQVRFKEKSDRLLAYFIEQKNQKGSSENIDDEDFAWSLIKQIRTDKHMSWVQLREGCNAILTGSGNYRPGAKTFANKAIKETDATAMEIINMLDDRNL